MQTFKICDVQVSAACKGETLRHPISRMSRSVLLPTLALISNKISYSI
jgi:hypothetical protein